MLNYKLKIGLLPIRRTIKEPPNSSRNLDGINILFFESRTCLNSPDSIFTSYFAPFCTTFNHNYVLSHHFYVNYTSFLWNFNRIYFKNSVKLTQIYEK